LLERVYKRVSADGESENLGHGLVHSHKEGSGVPPETALGLASRGPMTKLGCYTVLEPCS